MCSSLDPIFWFIMLTNKVQSAGNRCKPLHVSPINIHDVCTSGSQNIRLKKRKNFCTSTKAVKLTARAHTYARLWTTWAWGHWVGVLVTTYLWITYHVVTHIFTPWVKKGEPLTHKSSFSGFRWHLAYLRLNWQLLWRTKQPCVITLLVSKPTPHFWLVNSTSKHEAKKDTCCQSGSSHVEKLGKIIVVDEARRWEEVEKEERGGWEVQRAFYMQIFCIS